MDQVTIPIPPDEALLDAYNTPHTSHCQGLRAVATLAADQAVKEAVLRIGSRLMGLPSREYRDVMTVLTTDFPSAFAPTPPKEQQPVPSDPVFGPRELPTLSLVQQVNGLRQQLDESREIVKRLSQALADTKRDCPSPDPATATHDDTVRSCIAYLHSQGFSWAHAADAHLSARFLPTPAPEPVYVELDTSGYSTSPVAKLTVAEIAARHGLLTPETALVVSRQYFNSQPLIEGRDDLLADLRRAAKGGGE